MHFWARDKGLFHSAEVEALGGVEPAAKILSVVEGACVQVAAAMTFCIVS